MSVINPLKFVEDTKWNNISNNEIILHDAVKSKLEKFNTYNFFGRNVPRVSEILKKCLGKDYLVIWAAKLGIEEYKKESNRTLYIGSIVHEVIENYLLHGTIEIPSNIRSIDIKNKISTAVNNFINWYQEMLSKGYSIKIIAIEKQITCPWFGGTIDCIMNISHNETGFNKNFIVDFKTSKSISIDYLLQTYSYLWAEKWNKLNGYYDCCIIPDIDGIGIIRIDKETIKHEDLFLTFENNFDILMELDYAFSSMINWFYQIMVTEYNLKLSKKGSIFNG